MKTKNSLIAILLFLVCLSCKQKANSIEQCAEKPRDGRACTAVYQPVCGCNNRTYGNACEAEARGIARFTDGECKPPTADAGLNGREGMLY